MDISLMYFEAEPAHSVFAWKSGAALHLPYDAKRKHFPQTGARSQLANITLLQSPHVKAQLLPVILGAL